MSVSNMLKYNLVYHIENAFLAVDTFDAAQCRAQYKFALDNGFELWCNRGGY